MLSSYFSDAEIRFLSSDTEMLNELLVYYPPVDVWKTNLSTESIELDRTKFELQKVINATKSQQKIFRSNAEKVAHYLYSNAMKNELQVEQETATGKWYSDYVIYGLSGLTLISLAMTVINSWRLRVVFVTLARVTDTHAARVPSLVYTVQSSSILTSTSLSTTVAMSNQTSVINMLANMSLNDWSLALIWLLTILFIITVSGIILKRIVRKYCSKSTYFFLVLQVGNLEESYNIYLNKLYHTPESYSFTSDTNLQSLQVIGTFWPYVVIAWPNFQICHEALGSCTRIKIRKRISILTAYKLKRIIQGNYWHLIFTAVGGHLTKISVKRITPTESMSGYQTPISQIGSSAPILRDLKPSLQYKPIAEGSVNINYPSVGLYG